MTDLWIPPSAQKVEPPKVKREHKDATAQRRALLREMFLWQTPVCSEWTAELKKIDPYLCLAQAKENVVYPGITPGAYHMIRLNPDAPETIYAALPGEPSSGLLDQLRAMDLQNPQVVKDRTDAIVREYESVQRERERDTEDRQAEMVDRLKSLTETRVSMTDVPWSQNVKGRKKAA